MGIQDRFSRWLIESDPPGVGIEFRHGEAVIAGLADKRGKRVMDLCMSAPLPAGLLQFSMVEPNILDSESLVQQLGRFVQQAGLSGGRVALTLPDPLCRVSVQQLPEASSDRQELIELLRFRLKKSLPFPSENARIAYERLDGSSANPRFLTGVMFDGVAEEYESLLTELRFEVAVILPSSYSILNLLAPLAAEELGGGDYFFVNAEHDYFSLTLVQNGKPALTRTLGLRDSDASDVYQEDDLVQELIPTALYYQQKLKGNLERVYYRSMRPDLTNLASVLNEQFETPVEPFELLRSIEVGKRLQLDPDLADAVAAAAGGAFGRVA